MLFLWIVLRPLLTLVLWALFFVGFLWWALQANVADKLLTAEFYTDTISQQDAYNRIYDEVLLDQDLEDTTQDLLGGVQVVSQQEVADLLRDILPPDYLRSQTEASIQRTVAYFNGDEEELDFFIDLGPPLDNVEPVIFEYIDGRIDELEEQDLGALGCTEQQANDVADVYRDRWQRLSEGEAPSSIPSLASVQPDCRVTIFNLAFDDLLGQEDLDDRARRGLGGARDDLEAQFVAGDAKGVLKLAARPLVAPLVDDAVADIRDELDSQDRFDLVHSIADWNDDVDEPELRSDIDSVRDVVSEGRQYANLVGLVALLVTSVLMLALHFPDIKIGLRFLGLTIFSTGLFFFIAGKVAQGQIPGRVQDLVDQNSDQLTDVPAAATRLVDDILVSFGQQLAGGFDVPALVLLVIGVVVFVGSFFLDRIWSALRSLWVKPEDDRDPPGPDYLNSGEPQP